MVKKGKNPFHDEVHRQSKIFVPLFDIVLCLWCFRHEGREIIKIVYGRFYCDTGPFVGKLSCKHLLTWGRVTSFPVLQGHSGKRKPFNKSNS